MGQGGSCGELPAWSSPREGRQKAPGTQEAAALGGQARGRLSAAGTWLRRWEPRAGPGKAGRYQPGTQAQLAGPEKASCGVAAFETLTNKVFFSF